MPPSVFPLALANDIGWSLTKSPSFAVRRQASVDGRQLRVLDQPLPIWLFTYTIEFLPDGSDNRANVATPLSSRTDLRNLMGFFLTLQGGFSEFYITDPTDNTVVGQFIGDGDGTTTAFQLVRYMGVSPNVFSEPIYAVNTSKAFNVYINGVLQSSGSYSLNANTGVLTFTSAPTATLPITVDFSYYFVVNFDEDNMDFEYFLYQLWKVGSIKMRSQLP
jgi:uncharacterized protein (TIGR02217 family)